MLKWAVLASAILTTSLAGCGEVAPSAPDNGWRELTLSDGPQTGQFCMAYDGQAFAVPASVSMPIPTACSGRYRFLDRESPTIGYEFEVSIPNADPSEIPEAWRRSRPISDTDWVWDGETEITYAGKLEFRLLDEFGFEIASLSGDEIQVRSGETNHLMGTLILTEAQKRPLRSIEASLTLTHCFLCEPPTRE